MIRLIALMLLAAFSIQSLGAATVSDAATKLPEYEPYAEDEFPIWSGKLRRAESLFFGSFPITLPVVVLAYNLAVNLGASPVEEDPGLKTALVQFGIAAGVSFSIALTDFIIGEIQGE
jgi:hypothetical protein